MEAFILALAGFVVGVLFACWRLRARCQAPVAGSRTLGNLRAVLQTNVAGGPGPRPD